MLVVVDNITAFKRMVLTADDARLVIGLVDIPLDSHDTATVVAPQVQIIVLLRALDGIDSQAHSIERIILRVAINRGISNKFGWQGCSWGCTWRLGWSWHPFPRHAQELWSEVVEQWAWGDQSHCGRRWVGECWTHDGGVWTDNVGWGHESQWSGWRVDGDLWEKQQWW